MKRTVIGRCRSALILLLAGLLAGCSGAKPASVYADAESWAYAETDVTDKTTGVFFVTPTVCLGTEKELNWDSYDEETKASFVGAINREKGICDDDARLLFSPSVGAVGERCAGFRGKLAVRRDKARFTGV